MAIAVDNLADAESLATIEKDEENEEVSPETFFDAWSAVFDFLPLAGLIISALTLSSQQRKNDWLKEVSMATKDETKPANVSEQCML